MFLSALFLLSGKRATSSHQLQCPPNQSPPGKPKFLKFAMGKYLLFFGGGRLGNSGMGILASPIRQNGSLLKRPKRTQFDLLGKSGLYSNPQHPATPNYPTTIPQVWESDLQNHLPSTDLSAVLPPPSGFPVFWGCWFFFCKKFPFLWHLATKEFFLVRCCVGGESPPPPFRTAMHFVCILGAENWVSSECPPQLANLQGVSA